MSTGNTLIAGRHGGKKVYVVPAYKPHYDVLHKAARGGSHWARLAVLGLTSLASGRLGKDNIFVRPNETVRRGTEEFFVFLPGCKATVERMPDDSYKIVGLALDTGYFEINSQNSMTGLYSAKKASDQWEVKFIKSGRLEKLNVGAGHTFQRIVAISGAGAEDARITAQDIAPLISKAPGGNARATNFELHYTGGKKKRSFGGLRNYNAAINPLGNSELNGSAQMLAYTMAKAKDFEGMNWVAEQGGSAVLTQAMKILVDQGVKLNGHTAFLYRPSTSPNEAVKLAHQLDMDLDRNFAHSLPLDFIGNRDSFEMALNRLKHESSYKIGHAATDVGKALGSISAGLGAAVGALTFAGVPVAVPAIPALATIGGLLAKAAVLIKTTDAAVETANPRFYHRHIGKIK